MDILGLNKETLGKIKTDPILSGKVAAELGVVPGSLIRLLLQNHSKLTQAGVLKVICEHLGIEDSNELLEIQITA